MRFDRLLSALAVLSAAALFTPAAHAAVPVQKTYTRKIYVHMMPWFIYGQTHWSMNSRNSATGIASWYAPMIGEYSSEDGNVIEYQLLMMKYAGIDGVLIDWPGLNGANDLPHNKAAADTIIGRTADFGLEFGVCYEDQYAVSVDAAKNDMSYVRDNFFTKPNHIQVSGVPVVLVFGPQKITNSGDWTNIMSVFPTNPMLFSLWYNDNAGSNADGHFAWLAQNGMKGVSDFDTAVDGADEGSRIPVLYPGFNTYYAQGGWPGPTYKLSYTLNQDNTDTGSGDTLTSGFELGKYAGQFLQIATWNDYGEGTMIEPTNQFQYKSLTTLQQLLGLPYTDAELKIIKMLFDQRRATNGSNAAQLDKASQALANLDLATACSILGCTVPVHPVMTGGAGSGAGGSSSAGGSPGSAGMVGVGGSPAAGGAPTGTAGMPAATGAAGKSSTGTGGATAAAGSPGKAGTANSVNEGPPDDSSSSSCSVAVAGSGSTRSSAWLLAAVGALAFASKRRRRRA